MLPTPGPYRAGYLLDEPATAQAILSDSGVSRVPASLVIYVLLRRSLLDHGIQSRTVADYLAALVLQFAREKRALRVAEHDDVEYGYLVDIVSDLDSADRRRAFLLRAHLGNFALWLSGLFPDYIVARVHRKGGPGLEYYEEMGRVGFGMAAEDPIAREQSLDELYRDLAGCFEPLRRALNRFSDTHLLPVPASPADRLIRQVQSGFGSV